MVQWVACPVLCLLWDLLLLVEVICRGMPPQGPGVGTRRGGCPDPGIHWKRKGFRGGHSSSQKGGWRRLSKRLGAVTVGYRCH